MTRPRGWLRGAPNALTIGRLGLAVWLPLAPAPWRLWIVLGAGATDLMDGLIARRFGVTSALGGLLDAVADKVFLFVTLGTLLAADQIEWWQAALALARDLVVAFAAVRAVTLGLWDAFLKMPSRLPGKITTMFLFSWFVVLFAGAPDWLGWVLFVLVAASSVVAAADYAVLIHRTLRGYFAEQEHADPRESSQ